MLFRKDSPCCSYTSCRGHLQVSPVAGARPAGEPRRQGLVDLRAAERAVGPAAAGGGRQLLGAVEPTGGGQGHAAEVPRELAPAGGGEVHEVFTRE